MHTKDDGPVPIETEDGVMSDTVDTTENRAVEPSETTSDDLAVLGDRRELSAAIEAVLMVTEAPIEPRLLAQLVDSTVDVVEEVCAELDAGYRADGRGFVLTRVAGGYRFQSHPDQAAYVERFVLEGQSARLSAAALETLAIVAYKQPISRAQIASIRGVSVDAVVRTLTQRGYIAEISRDSGPGQAVLYGTTPSFLERMGLDSIADLPDLGAFVPDAEVVEALEHGLRFDPDEAIETADVNDADEAIETADVNDPDEAIKTAEVDDADEVDTEDSTDVASDDVIIDLREL